jgi:hypothetical protein
MNGWQLQAMWEADAAAAWEALNAPDPAERQMKEAADSLDVALNKINDGIDWVADAVSKLKETPMEYKVVSFMEDFEKLVNGLEDLKDHYERGERE